MIEPHEGNTEMPADDCMWEGCPEPWTHKVANGVWLCSKHYQSARRKKLRAAS